MKMAIVLGPPAPAGPQPPSYSIIIQYITYYSTVVYTVL